MSARNLSPQQFSVEHLAQFANPDRMSDPRWRKNVDQLTESFNAVGYHRSRGPAFMNRTHGAPEPHKDIELVHLDSGSFLNNGNHRVFAAQQAGLSTLPAVEKDLRTDRTKPIQPRPEMG